MKRLLFIFFLLLNTYKSYSCSCGHKKITQEEYDNYSLIFIGEIIEVEDCDNKGYQEFTFKIEQIFKGQTTKFVSGFNNCGGVCNNLYKRGQKWLIYSNPEYGLINDQYACNPSIVIALEENKVLIGPDYYVSKQDWEFEINFLKNRINKDVKIVNFQFIKIIPLLKQIFILGLLFLFFLFCYKFKLRLLPFSLGAGIISGFFYYLFISSNLFQELEKFRIIHVFLIFGILSISNFIFLTWGKDKLSFMKSFLFNYSIYISTIITCVYLIILNEHKKIEFNSELYKILFIIIIIGILFSLLIAIILLIAKYIRLKIIKKAAYNNG